MAKDKQFTLECESDEICQVAKDGEYLGTDEVVDILNEQEEHISQLREAFAKLKQENQELKMEVEEEKNSLTQYKTMVHNIFQNKFDEAKGESVWLMNIMSFLRFAASLGIELK